MRLFIFLILLYLHLLFQEHGQICHTDIQRDPSSGNQGQSWVHGQQLRSSGSCTYCPAASPGNVTSQTGMCAGSCPAASPGLGSSLTDVSSGSCPDAASSGHGSSHTDASRGSQPSASPGNESSHKDVSSARSHKTASPSLRLQSSGNKRKCEYYKAYEKQKRARKFNIKWTRMGPWLYNTVSGMKCRCMLVNDSVTCKLVVIMS